MAIGLAALRLLIIDDNAQMRTIVGAVLAGAGVRHLRYAADGRQGLRALAEFQPDVCYVDHEMPVMNGTAFIKAVRGMESQARYMPIIMLTGHCDMSRLAEARDSGATEFLCKPVTAHTILTRLEAVILHPRPFIQANGFFGPERRRRSEPNYAGPLRRRMDSADVLEL